MIQCPDCRSQIPDDSAFCDQCGKELKWCPECKRPKRGTECPFCGSDLIPGRKYFAPAGEAAAPDPVHGSAVHPSQSADWAPPSNNAEGGTPLGGSTSPDIAYLPAALVGNGWRLRFQSGAFGRVGGIWPELGGCQYVSGSHGRIEKDAGGWLIVDTNSTNGTFVNGQRLAAGCGAVLQKGDRVRIATLDFVVE